MGRIATDYTIRFSDIDLAEFFKSKTYSTIHFSYGMSHDDNVEIELREVSTDSCKTKSVHEFLLDIDQQRELRDFLNLALGDNKDGN